MGAERDDTVRKFTGTNCQIYRNGNFMLIVHVEALLKSLVMFI